MSGAGQVQQLAAAAEPPMEYFEFKGVEHLYSLFYWRPTFQESERFAYHFFEGKQEKTEAVDVEPCEPENDDALDDEPLEPENDDALDDEPSDEEAEADFAPDDASDDVDDDDYEPDVKEETKSSSATETANPTPENTVTVPTADSAALARCQKELATANGQLAVAAQRLAETEQRLALAEERLSIMHKQCMHSSQELEAAARAFWKSNSDHVPFIESGSQAFLVHHGSMPFIRMFVRFKTPFHAPPKVLVGMQTSTPYAMALVVASEIRPKGFWLHADLANNADFANDRNLIKCLASWMAFEAPRADGTDPHNGTGSSNGHRHAKRVRA